MQRLHSTAGLRPRNSAEESKAMLDAVETLHGVRARFVGMIAVRQQFLGRTVWKGLDSRFELRGHPAADLCYAWSVPATDARRHRFYVHTSEVNSAKKAVSASFTEDRLNSLLCDGANDAEYPDGRSARKATGVIDSDVGRSANNEEIKSPMLRR